MMLLKFWLTIFPSDIPIDGLGDAAAVTSGASDASKTSEAAVSHNDGGQSLEEPAPAAATTSRTSDAISPPEAVNTSGASAAASPNDCGHNLQAQVPVPAPVAATTSEAAFHRMTAVKVC